MKQDYEQIDNEKLITAVVAINLFCYKDELPFIPEVCYLPPEMEFPDTRGAWWAYKILLSRAYYEAHGIDTAVLNTLFHETLHMYCSLHNIESVRGINYHTRAFAQAAKEHGGIIYSYDKINGYSDVRIFDDVMRRIKKALRG